MIKFSNKKENTLEYKCTIRLLDDNAVLECEFQSYQKGRFLLDYVFNKLDLVETDYFGLRFVDHHKQRHWLDPNKNILRQIKNLNPILFCFRVKFYPVDPMKLREEISRYYLFLQLRRDLLHGRLYCTPNDSAILSAYIVQADLGDFNTDEHQENYINDYKILLKQTPKLEDKIVDTHKTLKGLSPSLAEIQFLKKASTLDTYGVDPYVVKDHRGLQLYLGLNHSGILTFHGSRKTLHFRWNEVQKLNYEGKMFIIHLIFMEDARTKRKHTVGFKCPSATNCRHLWKAAVEQRLFYTMDNSNKHGVVVTGGSFFSRGSRFRYQGRCEKEVAEESTNILRDPPPVKRISLKNAGRSSSLPSTPADSDNYEMISRVHRPLPYMDRSTSLDEEVLCGTDSPTTPEEPCSRTNGASKGAMGAYCSESTLPPLSLLEPLLEANETKSRSSSILDANYQPDSLLTVEDEFLQHQLLYDCSGQSHPVSTHDTSSTETLGSPNDSLERPFLKKIGSSPAVEVQDHLHLGYKIPDSEYKSTFKSSLSSGSEYYSDSLRRAKSVTPIPPSRSPASSKKHQEGKKKLNLVVNCKFSFFRFAKVFFIALILVVVILSFLVILIFEVEFSLLENIRNCRELLLLRVQYYQPLRRYLSALQAKF